MAFEEQHFSGFAPSRGWPIRAWTFANEDGCRLVEASVVMGGNIVYRDGWHGNAYRHLVIHPEFVGLDVLVAFALLSISWLLPRKIVTGAMSNKRSLSRPGAADRSGP